MNARYVSVVTRDGQNILVPNESMMNDKVHNLSFENTLVQVRQHFLVVFNSDLAHAKRLVDEILSKTEGIEHSQEYACLISEFTDTAVKFEIRYWIDAAVAQSYLITHNILMQTWQAFKDNNIELYSYGQPAFPSKTDEAPKVAAMKTSASHDEQAE
jgi:small-conductance mechanosensitive channel